MVGRHKQGSAVRSGSRGRRISVESEACRRDGELPIFGYRQVCGVVMHGSRGEVAVVVGVTGSVGLGFTCRRAGECIVRRRDCCLRCTLVTVMGCYQMQRARLGLFCPWCLGTGIEACILLNLFLFLALLLPLFLFPRVPMLMNLLFLAHGGTTSCSHVYGDCSFLLATPVFPLYACPIEAAAACDGIQ